MSFYPYVKRTAFIVSTALFVSLALPASFISVLPFQAKAAAAAQEVQLTYPASSVTLTMDKRLPLEAKLKRSEQVRIAYTSGNTNIVKVNANGVIIPISKGTTNINMTVTTPGYKGKLSIPVTVKKTSSTAKPVYAAKKVKAAGKTFTVQTVTLPKGMPVTAGLASGRVGATQSLSSVVSKYQAQAALNGTYFEAYGGVPDPYGMIISDGTLEHIGNSGTSIGFKWDGSAVMDTLRVRLLGTVREGQGRAQNWYAYFVNRTPTKGKTSAVMYTPKRGNSVGFAYGTAVTVRKDIVTKVAKNTNATIPKDGYVLVFTGTEEKMADKFKTGAYVDYNITYNTESGKKIDWDDVHTAIGAGPRLVTNGKLSVNPASEGFSSSKILTDSGARSGIAIKKDGSIMLATVSGATIKQWGSIMVELGAYQAMNMDGGASSGLYANGRTITSPGRLISNGLVFGNSLVW
ncbi:phosphodiester glycosidase family protein [Paenibacillus sp. Marseille-Q4541]|uniref:phosphodiester glycosidase family protein n=1 Tax=Paenibacillus sp. Marseille-Q4541 TaxID=2831522 RepID=UPI0020197E1C|nr:phosphodiester glycosidase family protein [Paenibacillus sp. Marseille-Q4541]